MRKATAVCCLLAMGCSQGTSTSKKMSVFVSILPQRFIVERIGGTHVDVSVMVQPGASPHSYEPRPSQMAALSRARLYFAIGVEFENAWLARLAKSNPSLAVIHTDQNIDKLEMTASGEKEHPRHESGEYGHEGADPHIWLSPTRVKQIAAVVAASLAGFDSRHASDYRENLARFTESVDSLRRDIDSILQSSPVKSFMVFHPSWGYFADEFGLSQIPIETEGKEPSPRELTLIADTARALNITTVFVQPQMSQKTAGVLARQLGATITAADPLAYNWDENLRAVARAIAAR